MGVQNFNFGLPITLICFSTVYSEFFPKLCEKNNKHITRVGFYSNPRPLQF